MTMSLLLSCDDYLLYHCPITHGNGSKRDDERAATRTLILEAFGPDASLGHTAEGAPLLTSTPQTRISISHSDTSCLLAVSAGPHRIGVDTELPRCQLLRIAPRILAGEESLMTQALPDDDSRLDMLLKLWTAKEAVYKAALTPGLPLAGITVAPDFTRATALGHSFRLDYHRLPEGELIAVAILAG